MAQSSHMREKGFFMKGIGILAALFVVLAWGSVDAKGPGQKTFSSPQAAVEALAGAVRADDRGALLAIFGPGSRRLLFSGDRVEDRHGRERFLARYEEGSRLEESAEKAVLHLGKDEWPFPIPLVKKGDRWRFDTREGEQEILARRIGRNELSAIQACLAYVDAQKEYAMRGASQGHDLLEYAQRFASTPGKHDGLYWDARQGEEQSPMGPLFAAAREEGYGNAPLEEGYRPYLGYVYRILTAQGRHAPGGARDYIVRGMMIGGFALVAYPARYGSSGVMTFMVSQDGVVFQKDLGRQTRKAARALKVFDPDGTWTRVPG